MELEQLDFIYLPAVLPQGSIPEDWDVSPEALRSWRVKAYHAWCASWHKVRSVDRSNRTIIFENPVSEQRVQPASQP